MDKNWLILLQRQNQLPKILKTNQTTKRFGLTLCEQDAKLILEEQNHALCEPRRVEFGAGIAEKLIYEFCDSDFITPDTYVDTIIRLQKIFYLYKNEMQDEITDDELVHLMKEQAYTAFGSTSVSYEKAEQLMAAVLYCMHETEAYRVYGAGKKCNEAVFEETV